MNNPNQQTPRGPWSMIPGILPEKMRQVDCAIFNHALFKALEEEKRQSAPRQFTLSHPQEQVYIGSPDQLSWRENLRDDDQIVNFVPVIGLITRDPTWWAWSGVEIRDNILRANEDPLVQAHLLYLNTPGGESAALYDIQLAVNEARKRGISVYGFIDGMACSLGCGVAALCDKVYFRNNEDKIGSIGVYWSFTGTKHGTTDQNGNTYIEIYDDQSYDKNKAVRDAIDGDESEALALLQPLRNDLVNIIKSGRPSVIDEQLHGKVYRAADVIGTLVDGQADLITVATQAIAAYAPVNRPESGHKPTSPQNQTTQSTNPKALKQMNFQHLCTYLGVEALAIDEEKGSYIQQTQLEQLEEILASYTTVQSQLAELTKQFETARSEYDTAITEKNNLIAEKEQQLTTATARITTLQEENNRLAQTAGAPPAVEQQQTNNDPEEETNPVARQSVIKPTMTLEEKCEAVRKRKSTVGY